MQTHNKLAIDFGNSYINTVATNKKGELKKACIQSTWNELMETSIINRNVVEYEGKIIQIGSSNGDEFTNVRKVEREHLEHQVLWCAYKTLGAGDHYVKLAAGLPLMDYTQAVEKEGFKKHLESFKILTGMVEGKEVTVHIVAPVVIAPEGYSAVDVLSDIIPKTKKTLIIDIGMKTTDYALVEYNEEEDLFDPVTYNTVRKGLDSIYAPCIAKLKTLGTTITPSALDATYRKGETITLANKEEFDVVAEVLKAVQPCKSILKAIENDPAVGNMTDYHKILIGGGAKALEDIASTEDLTNVVDTDSELKYYANAMGYLAWIEE